MLACEGERDPRILPLHIFDLADEYVDLDRRKSRRAFDSPVSVSRPALIPLADSGSLPTVGSSMGHRGGSSFAVSHLPIVFTWMYKIVGLDRIRVATPDRAIEIFPDCHANIYPNAVMRIGKLDGRELATAGADKARASAVRRSAKSGRLRGNR